MIKGKEQFDLSPTELSVLAMLAGGMADIEMAFALDVSADRVIDLVNSVFEKLGVTDRASAIELAIERGLVQTDI